MTRHAHTVVPTRGVRLTQEPTATIVPVYVWEFPVRLSHWLIVLSIFVLSFTGYSLGRPFISVAGQAKDHFATGTMRAVHFYAATVFGVAVIMRLYWMFFSRNRFASWRQFIPTTRRRWQKFWHVLRFYLFLSHDSPMTVGHNPLAGLTYTFVFALYVMMMLTGLGIYAPETHLGSPLRLLAFLAPMFGGLQMSRWLHHIGMWLLLGFFVHHLASALLVSRLEHNGILDSIFSGFKYLNVSHYYQDQKDHQHK